MPTSCFPIPKIFEKFGLMVPKWYYEKITDPIGGCSGGIDPRTSAGRESALLIVDVNTKDCVCL